MTSSSQQAPAPNTLTAHAKINLALHVVGQRDDGYHLLDTLVTFAEVGDVLTFAPAPELALGVSGAEAEHVPTDGQNLILKAAEALISHSGKTCPGASIHLKKNLPVASGMGGGSANAAAALKGLNAHWDLRCDEDQLSAIGLTLGADVPMCLKQTSLRACGTGELIEPVSLPRLYMVLVNPRIPVSTPEVFSKLAVKNNDPMDLSWQTSAMTDALSTLRNDLEEPAISCAPIIGTVLDELRQLQSCHLARMTGSGATCFGLFDDPESADLAAEKILHNHSEWWVVSTHTIS